MTDTAILINTCNRATELALLLQSLRTQTNKDFDVYILEDSSNIPLTNFHFFHCLVNRMKLEGNKVFYQSTPFNYGVSRARQAIVDWALGSDYKYFMRVDDDVILEDDYLERMLAVFTSKENYSIASGVTSPMIASHIKRDAKNINKYVNRVILDKEGNYIFNGDDCGITYLPTNKILPAHHFRSCALMKREVHEKVKYYPTKLSKHGFREEQIFSYKAQLEGFKIGVDLNAMAWHQLTPSGGERPTTNLTPFNQQILLEFTKEYKDELNKIFPYEELDSLELNKETNLR